MSGRTITVECKAEVDVIDALESLGDEEREQAREVLDGRDENDAGPAEIARRLAVAIEQGDGRAAADHAHRLCSDLAGLPVVREISIGPAPWEKRHA